MLARLLLFTALLSAPALAQGPRLLPGFDLERFSPNPGAQHTLTLSTADALPARTLRISLWGHYEAAPLTYTVDGEVAGAAVSYRVTTHLLAAYGLTSWAEVGLALPVVLAQGGDDLYAYGYAPPTSTAMGAPWLTGRFTFLREAADRPLDLAATAALSLPFGSTEALTKDQGTGLAARAQVEAGRSFAGMLRVGAQLGAVFRGPQDLTPKSTAVADEVGTAFSFGVALSTFGHDLRGELSFRGLVPFVSSPVSMELLGAVRYRLPADFEVSVVAGPGFGHAPGTPAFRALLGFAWAPSFADQPRD